MENALESNEWRRNIVHQTFKIELQKRRPNNSNFHQNPFLQKLGPPFLIFRNFKTLREELLNHGECIEI